MKAVIPRELKTPKFPSIVAMKEWDAAMIKGLCTACKIIPACDVVKWYMEGATKTYEELSDVGGELWGPIDTLMGSKLQALPDLPDKLKSDLERLGVKAMEQGAIVTGRQTVWMIKKWFQTEDHGSLV